MRLRRCVARLHRMALLGQMSVHPVNLGPVHGRNVDRLRARTHFGLYRRLRFWLFRLSGASQVLSQQGPAVIDRRENAVRFGRRGQRLRLWQRWALMELLLRRLGRWLWRALRRALFLKRHARR